MRLLSYALALTALTVPPLSAPRPLPVVMTGPAGATLPLLFGGSDAGYSQSQSIGSQIGFDPKQPFVITFSQNGRGSVFLGGTAQPVPTQRAGSYTATITLTVVSLP